MKHLKHLLSLFLSLGLGTWSYAQEICDNGIDDDADGLIDLNDTTDCDGFVVDGQPYMLPNRSFELYDCLPSGYTQLECADTWSQATNGTSDYFRTDAYFLPFIPQPLPYDGLACVGGYICPDYMEYIGGCLTQPMLSGVQYSFNLSVTAVRADTQLSSDSTMDLPPTYLVIWGLDSCPGWPINTQICPENEGWVAIGWVEYTPTTDWQGVFVELYADFDVHAIMIGSSCDPEGYPLVAGNYLGYFFYDEMSASESAPEMRSIEAHGSLCQGTMKLYVHPSDQFASMQWYRDGIAIANETDSILDISAHGSGAGLYACRVSSGASHVIARYPVDDPNGDVPTIAQMGTGLFCDGTGFYQWYLDGSEIFGATASYFEPVYPGSYTVRVTSGEGCSATSAPYAFINMGIGTVVGNGIQLLHAPGTDHLAIVGAADPFSFSLLDVTGRIILSERGQGARWERDLSFLPEGVYTAMVDDHAVRFVR